MTVEDLVAKYKATFTAGAKEKNTARTEKLHLGHAERILGGPTPVTQVTSAAVQAYIDARVATKYKGRPINPQTVKKEVATLKYVWNWAFRNEHVGSRFPGVGLVFPKAKLKEPFRTLEQIRVIVERGGLTKAQVRELWDAVYLNPSEIAGVLEHVRVRDLYPWLYPFVATAAHTGARRSELLRARVDDFDFVNRVVILREKKRSKDRETFRSVELTPFLERLMREYFGATHPPAGCSPSPRGRTGRWRTGRTRRRSGGWCGGRSGRCSAGTTRSALVRVGAGRRGRGPAADRRDERAPDRGDAATLPAPDPAGETGRVDLGVRGITHDRSSYVW